LVKIRQSYAEVTATQRRLLKQKEQADAVAMDWYKRAQLALEKGNDELAKEALTRRQMALDEAATLQSQVSLQTASIDKLYDGMQILEKKILEAKSKKEQMVARARTAQASQKVNEVSAEMGVMGALSAGSDIEQQFKLLEAGSSVDDELAKMKQNLLTGSSSSSSSSSTTTSSTSTSSASGSAPPVDDELERLKRDAGL
jgi:phage shock protein A